MKISCPKCRTENTDDSQYCRKCATPLPRVSSETAATTLTPGTSAFELPSGSTFAGRYAIIEEIGHGGMGRVYKAFDSKIGEKIALKLICADIAGDRSVVERFANELRLARKITHRNVCRMYDLGEEHGTAFITMEYVSGEDLKSMLRMTGGLSPGQTISIARQIASGLSEAHRLGVIHRDLKPHNIMIDRDGTARIMDFGIACSERTRGLTDRGAIIGTPDYMSPEQAEGEQADARSDIYSLGVMMFEMATGRLPFEGKSALAVAMRHKSELPLDPASLKPQIPHGLSAVILKCLEKDRAARYQAAAEVAVELERIGSELPAITPALPQRAATTLGSLLADPWRNRLPAAWLVAALLAVAGIAWLFFGRRQPEPVSARTPNSVAVVGFENQTGDPRFDHLSKAIPNLIITSLENTGRYKVATWERMRDVLSQSGRKDVDFIDVEGGFEACRREGITFIVTGSFTKAGDFFATDVKVLNAENRALVKSVTSRGEGENSILRIQVDEIGREIARSLAPAGSAPERTVQIVDVTTNSMDAYAAFLRGRDAVERFHHAAAIDDLKKAVEIDPEFASAHYLLSSAYDYMLNRVARDQEIKLAKQFAAKSSERERMFIDAKYAKDIEGNWDNSVRALKTLVDHYPEDKTAHFELGLEYIWAKRKEDAAHSLERTLELDPTHGLALNSLAFIYLDLGKTDLALKCLERYAAANPRDGNPVDSMADMQMRLGRLDDAVASYQKALALQSDMGSELALAEITALQENYAAAFQWIDRFIQNAPSETRKADGYGLRAILLQLVGQSAAARTAVAQFRDMSDKSTVPYLVDFIRGWLEYDNKAWAESRKAFQKARDAQMKMTKGQSPLKVDYNVALALVDGAEGRNVITASTLEQLRAESPAGKLGVRRLQAALLSAQGGLDGAIAARLPEWPGDIPLPWLFDQAPYYLPLEQDDLAQLYVRKGDWDRALSEYRMLTVMGPAHKNRRLIHPIYHFRLAQVYEKKEMRTEAADQYERFLKLWAQADTHRPETEEARTRLSVLRK